MFWKYFKFEIRNSFLLPIIMCGITIITALFASISMFVKSYDLLSISSFAFLISVEANVIILLSIIIKTFTSRLFSNSGFLTLTLPISTDTLIITKVLVNVLYILLFGTTFILCGSIFWKAFLKLMNVEAVGGMAGLFSYFFQKFYDNPLPVLLQSITTLIEIVCILLCVLFVLSFCNTGKIKRQKKVLTSVYIIIFLIIIGTISNFDIIPYTLYYNPSIKDYCLIHNDISLGYDGLIQITAISKLIYNFIGVFAFYFGTRYLIRNKLDME